MNAVADDVDEVLAALADPTRRLVLDAVAARGEATATVIAAEFPVSRQAVVKHLAVLDRAGLVTGRRQVATVGPGLYLPHAIGAGFGPWVKIGANCTLGAGAAIGPQPFTGERGTRKYTVLGDDVYVGLHAVIIGGVTVGDGAVIGANAVVVRDVEPYTVISASPGRAVGTRAPGDTSPD